MYIFFFFFQAEDGIRDKLVTGVQTCALPISHLLEAAENDLVWEPGKFSVKGAPAKFKTIQEIAFAAYTNHPQGMEAGLEAVSYYDPPNLTYPFGSYICVVDIDKGTGEVKGRRVVAGGDCGNIIQPTIRDGPIPRGPAKGVAPPPLGK